MLDHDDLSHVDRLALEAAYLDTHPNAVLVGSAVLELSADRLAPEDQPTRTSPALLRLLLHVDNPLAWSSVMVRAEALSALGAPALRSEFEPADDFDLYHRSLELGEIARIDLPLTTYRWHASNASHSTALQMNTHAARVLRRTYSRWFGSNAACAAAIVVNHSSSRIPVSDAATMARLRDIVRGVASGLAEERPADRAHISAGAQLVLWRLTRAAVRSGHISLFRPPAPPFDAVASLIIGAIRAGLQLRPDQIGRV
jgi:hypothetical protein